MANFRISYSAILLIISIATSCGSNNTDKKPIKSNLKIVLTDSLSFEDDERHVPDNIREICQLINSDDKDCQNVIILDPTLIRVDLEKDFSLKTTIERGGSKDINNPKVIERLIRNNLDELVVPKEFAKHSNNKDTSVDITSYVNSKSTKDSVLVFIPESSTDEYVLNGKKYKIYDNVEEIRNRMKSILCENQKVGFTILINPLSSNVKSLALTIATTDCNTRKIFLKTIGGDGTPVIFKPALLGSNNEFSIPKTAQKGSTIIFTASQGNQVAKVNYTIECSDTQSLPPDPHGPKRKKYSSGDNGDLVMVPGSDGCDICTKYYKATDNIGRVREIVQRNSTECCPCGKTIEMRGRTYVMECEGGVNRLVLAN